MTATIHALRLNDVFRYRSERMNSHCREGLAIVVENHDGALVAQDTYWRVTRDYDSHTLSSAEWETAEFLGNLDDYRLVNVGENTRDYASSDVLNVHSQRGLTSRNHIRLGAEKNLDVMIENAQFALEQAESDLQSAQYKLGERRDHLEQLLEERASRETGTEVTA